MRARFEILFEGESEAALRSEISAVSPYGLETGDFLFSHYPNGLYSALVCLASGPVPGSRHGRNRVQLGLADQVAAALPDWLQRSELIPVGDYHTHPGGDPRPSPHDLKVWARLLKSSGRSSYVGVIATPGDGAGPRLHGWVVRTDGAPGRLVCEPARIDHK
jgi:hypothetical protein